MDIHFALAFFQQKKNTASHESLQLTSEHIHFCDTPVVLTRTAFQLQEHGPITF